jgi:hypothetical protein
VRVEGFPNLQLEKSRAGTQKQSAALSSGHLAEGSRTQWMDGVGLSDCKVIEDDSHKEVEHHHDAEDVKRVKKEPTDPVTAAPA